MSTVPSPAELSWRIGWLAGTTVARTAGATWSPSEPEPAPEPVPAWLQPPTLAELDPAPRRPRSRLVDSIRTEIDREARRVYVTAQQEAGRQIMAAYSLPPAQIRQLRESSFRYIAGPQRCAICQRQAQILRSDAGEPLWCPQCAPTRR